MLRGRGRCLLLGSPRGGSLGRVAPVARRMRVGGALARWGPLPAPGRGGRALGRRGGALLLLRVRGLGRGVRGTPQAGLLLLPRGCGLGLLAWLLGRLGPGRVRGHLGKGAGGHGRHPDGLVEESQSSFAPIMNYRKYL